MPTERRRHLRRGRRRRADPVPEGVRAGARPDRRQEVHRQPVLGHPGAVRAARHARRRRVRRRCRHGRRPRHRRRRRTTQQHHRQVVQDDPAVRRRGAAGVERRSRTATTSTPWGLIKGLKAVEGDISGGQKKLQAAIGKVDAATRRTGRSSWTRTARRSSTSSTSSSTTKDGKLAVEDGRRDPGRRPDVRRHVLDEDAGAGTHVPAVREAEPAVDRQDASSRRSPASERVTAGSSTRARRADPPPAGDRPALRRPPRRARRRPRRRARRAARDPRPERRRQDDALQRHLGRRSRRRSGTIEFLGRRRHARCRRARARSSGWGAPTRSRGSSSACRSRTTSTSRCSASQAGHLRPVVLPRRDGELRERARELAARRRARRRASATLVGSLSHGEQRQLEVGDGARRRTRR